MCHTLYNLFVYFFCVSHLLPTNFLLIKSAIIFIHHFYTFLDCFKFFFRIPSHTIYIIHRHADPLNPEGFSVMNFHHILPHTQTRRYFQHLPLFYQNFFISRTQHSAFIIHSLSYTFSQNHRVSINSIKNSNGRL